MNPSLAYIRSSDGSGDASLMTITQVRTAPATTITVNTVAGAPTNFFAAMGTPHTFNDPVTGETITIISEATAVSFAGRIDSGKVEIVAIAPGETDLGSKVGDIIIIRPTTQWADNIHDVLSESLNDDGTLKNKAVTLPKINGGTTAGVLTTDASGNVTPTSIWWEELARVTYNNVTPLADLDSGVFAAKKYLKLIIVGQTVGGSYAFGIRFNNVTTASYADAVIYGSGSSTGYNQGASRNSIRASTTVPSGGSFYFEAEIMNVKELTKQFQGRATTDQGSGVDATFPPDNQLFSGKWVNTTDQITSIQMVKLGGGSGYGQKTELIVLGHD